MFFIYFFYNYLFIFILYLYHMLYDIKIYKKNELRIENKGFNSTNEKQ